MWAGIAQAAERRFCEPQNWGFDYHNPTPALVTNTWGLKPNGAARDCGSRFRGFDSLPSLQPLRGPVAQLAERRTCNAEVEISTFFRSTNIWLRSSDGRA